jgi:hypothetical protein
MAVGFLASFLWNRYRALRKSMGHRAILSGLTMPLIFVYPPRENVESAVLPRIATEDFLAINNVISAFMHAGLPAPEKVRDADHLTNQDRRKNNLILVCSTQRNPITKEAIDLVRSISPRFSDLVPTFDYDPNTKERRILWNRATYLSDSYHQEGPELCDIAMIIKARNPWVAQRKILVIAGIRGFGTWGAAEFLKKWWEPLYQKKSSSKSRKTSKSGEFVALVSVHYEDFDIKGVELLHLVDLDEIYHEPVR